MKIIQTANAPAAIGPYSQGIDTGSLVFFSGQIALTPNGEFLDSDLETQATQVFANIDALLAASQLSKRQLVKTTVFLSDLSNFTAFNQLYESWLVGDAADATTVDFPARSCVQAVLPKNALVEVEVIASR